MYSVPFFLFRVEKILISTSSCTFGCTLYFQTWKYRVHPKVQSTSESTKYTTHRCCNLFLRIRLKQKSKVRPINCDMLETILTWTKISSGMYQPLPSKPLLHMHFLYECNSISTIVIHSLKSGDLCLVLLYSNNILQNK